MTFGCHHGIGRNWDQTISRKMLTADGRSLRTSVLLISRDAAARIHATGATVDCCTAYQQCLPPVLYSPVCYVRASTDKEYPHMQASS